MHTTISAILCCTALGSGLALTAPGKDVSVPEQRNHAHPRLVLEHDAIRPGHTTHLGVHFRIDKDWHIYWNGQNDTGYPVVVDLELPEGIEAGEMIWPTPQRHVNPGGFGLDHIYEDEVTLLIPIKAVGKPGGPVRDVEIAASVEWLACKEVCIPEEEKIRSTFRLTLDRKAPTPSEDAELFAKARERVPTDAPSEGWSASWSENKVTVTVPGATSLVFMPSFGSAFIEDLVSAGEVRGERMTLSVEEQDDPDRVVKGVLLVQKGGTTRFWTIEVTPGG